MKTLAYHMGMPITVNIVGLDNNNSLFREVFDYFIYVDNKFSTYKDNSEITQINKHQINKTDYSEDMVNVLDLSEQTKKDTFGYFDININNSLDPSGLVKGWSIWNASKIISSKGYENFYIDAGGDIQANGLNDEGKPWTVGIKNPFKQEEIVKVLSLSNKGIATSGTYIRGNHIINPINKSEADDIASITIIADNVYEADRFATAAFAMGEDGINFIEKRSGLEGYMIDKNKIATYTSNFNSFTSKS